jgi:RHS repeat-associated protein
VQVLVAHEAGETSTYLYGIGRIGEDDGGGQYYLADHLGSVRALVDAEGSVAGTQVYQPYGAPLSSAGLAESVYGFTGEQADPTGLVYLRARMYAPELELFLSRDPWDGHPQLPRTLLQGFLYVQNNPIGFLDPTGTLRWNAVTGANPWYRTQVEDYYMLHSGDWVDLLIKQLEYSIPAGSGTGRKPDMFNSLTGDVYEVEPVYLMDNPNHGQAQAVQYVDWLLEAASDRWRALPTDPIPGGQGRAVIDWNEAPYHLGTVIDWPGKMRRNMGSIGYARWDIVADYYKPGVVVYWFEPSSRIPVPVPTPYPQRDPNRRAIRPPGWSPVPVRQTAYIVAKMGCYVLIGVGGALLLVGLIDNISGLGTIDDVITTPSALYLIDLGKQLMGSVSNPAPAVP